ncbi:MAG: undecaprenyldiphospho-muramoylpentapeptide beta-N-acetylglucosaminyltransferase [candidate division KSB1 bacterium]|nr:undecaprenyldiphospho-muramoylpentapeptide beta-N-acetylglucosaminyltransferase [candidate division KSB1 bacterium]MDZ7301567.1 undecaprenyldiphospho-muramoylpentapeptide beta-N-acetylglucosaminyltransferase [candidate division KSB1 bacterium]MDZ7311017.1 undecaprenyldiphospho-muramoylpentapeptide beta-N-acetylglucosaminyltransferase [candidate division KSB1 bacterium]
METQQKSFDALRIVFAGGGTGGHLFPAIAIAEAFQRRVQNFAAVFVGTARGLEARVIPQLGYRLELVPVRGLLRKLTLSNLLVPVYLLKSIWQCQRLFNEFDPQLIIGTGGYVSGPALIAAWISGRKFVVQEQNNFPGLVNRWLGKRAAAVFLSFEESKKFFRRQEHLHVVGNPVRMNLIAGDRHAAAEKWNLTPERITLLVFGGSQGARRINELMLEILPQLAQIEKFQILWATGPQHFEKIAAEVANTSNLRVVSFIDDMASAYTIADFVLCRAGASTIFELTLCGLPSILVPFPFATADHQTFNARALAKAGAARLLIEKELTADILLGTVRELATQPELRQKMAKAAKNLARPGAAEEIVEICLSLLDS